MTMHAIHVADLTYRYGRTTALDRFDLEIPEGALYALLGPNGSGKTTLLQVLTGLRRAGAGRATVLGIDSRKLTYRDRAAIGYVAEGQALPRWMRLEQLEAYLAPLYPAWDHGLARELRERFALDPAKKIGTLSRGDVMKVSLLCALAPRPRLLIMDEPFTGIDVAVREDLVRGLLASAGSEGWTVLVCSHDVEEVELLADRVGFMAGGRLHLSESADELRDRFKRVSVLLGDGAGPPDIAPEWLSVTHAGQLLSFIVPNATPALAERTLPARFPGARHIEVSRTSLRDVFVAMARADTTTTGTRGVA